MKKPLAVLMLVSVPLLFLLTVAQGARYYAVLSEVRRLEASQSDWIEENRKLLSNIAVARSRARVFESMKDAEGYRMVNPKATLRIQVQPGLEKRDG